MNLKKLFRAKIIKLVFITYNISDIYVKGGFDLSKRKVIENYYSDVSNLADLLGRLVNSYRLLIGGVGELNQIALATKNDVKNALKRVDKLGDVIDSILSDMDDTNVHYIQYCKLKSEFLKKSTNIDSIRTEIEEELKSSN